MGVGNIGDKPGQMLNLTALEGPVDAQGQPVPAVMIASSWRHFCAVWETTPRQVRCWGSNYYKTLSSNDPAGGYQPLTVDLGVTAQVLSITTGSSHTCVLLDTTPRQVRCWGGNTVGQLGRGSADFSASALGGPALLGSMAVVGLSSPSPSSAATCATVGEAQQLKCW
jgi:hypothetical protein